MIWIKDKKDCCGCGSCSQSCPSSCIQMLEDEEGFRYPVIKTELCTGCGTCKKNCPMQQATLKSRNLELPDVCAAVNKDPKIRKDSSSGGVFTLFAKDVLDKKGIVFGAAMAEDCKRVVHIAVEKEEQLSALRGSKYVESDIGDTYSRAETELRQGRTVLFSGTPCQIAGLKTYLQKDYDKLLTLEVICHGVPSSLLWRKYLAYIGEKLRASIAQVIFRAKDPGEGNRLLMWMKAENDRVYQAFEDEDPFYCFFLSNLCLRPSCYNCRFKGNNHVADITIGDFWGGNKIVPGFGKEGDTSLVLLHSEKGKVVFSSIKENLELCWTKYGEAMEYNSAYLKGVECPSKREQFFSDLAVMPFRKLVRKYRRRSVRTKLRSLLEKWKLLGFFRNLKNKLRI